MTEKTLPVRIPTLDGLVSTIERLEAQIASASQGRWYRTHGVVVAMDGDAVALTDPATLTRHGVSSHEGNPARENANARLICTAQNTLPSLLAVIRLLLDVPDARIRLDQERAKWVAANLSPTAAT